MEFFTIGVYNSTEAEFFNKLVEHRIDTFCDIRQRRAVRGSKYAFVNSNRLQANLAEMDIKYGHVLQLAPSKEIRELQKQADLYKGELKRNRQELGELFTSEFQRRILEKFDFDIFIENLEIVDATRIVLFCVEERPEACHRSLVSDKLKYEYAFKVTHI